MDLHLRYAKRSFSSFDEKFDVKIEVIRNYVEFAKFCLHNRLKPLIWAGDWESKHASKDQLE